MVNIYIVTKKQDIFNKLEEGFSNTAYMEITSFKMNKEKIAERSNAPQVTNCAPLFLINGPKKPAITAPTNGRKIASIYITCSSLHQIDVFDSNGAPIPEIDNNYS